MYLCDEHLSAVSSFSGCIISGVSAVELLLDAVFLCGGQKHSDALLTIKWLIFFLNIISLNLFTSTSYRTDYNAYKTSLHKATAPRKMEWPSVHLLVYASYTKLT